MYKIFTSVYIFIYCMRVCIKKQLTVQTLGNKQTPL